MAAPEAINDHFFKGIYKEVWRKMIPAGLSEAECVFIEDVAELSKGDAVLDLMCGYGRHSLPLARKGYTVTAIDNLQAYITEITSIAGSEQLPLQATAISALQAPFNGPYKAIICMGNSFAFFNRNEALQLLQKIGGHLAAGGVFIINSWMIAEIAMKHFKEREWLVVDDFKYLIDNRFYFYPHRIESEHTVIAPDKSIEVMHGTDYIFSLAELDELFKEAGLSTKAIYTTPKKRPFRFGDATIYIVVQKQVN